MLLKLTLFDRLFNLSAEKKFSDFSNFVMREKRERITFAPTEKDFISVCSKLRSHLTRLPSPSPSPWILENVDDSDTRLPYLYKHFFTLVTKHRFTRVNLCQTIYYCQSFFIQLRFIILFSRFRSYIGLSFWQGNLSNRFPLASELFRFILPSKKAANWESGRGIFGSDRVQKPGELVSLL